MLKLSVAIFSLITTSLFSMEMLPEKYLVNFGKEDAKFKIIQYYSLSCPHCIQAFRSDFSRILEEYIEKGELRYIFHPVPIDLSTLQLMNCLEALDEDKKRVMLKVVLEEVSLEDPNFNVQMLKRGMEILGKPIDELGNEEFLKSSAAFKTALEFVSQTDCLTSVPSIQIGDKVIEKSPDWDFISLIMRKIVQKDSDYEF